MKIFTVIASAFSAFVFFQGALAALSAQEVVVNVKAVTTISQNANSGLQQLTTSMSPQKAQTICQSLAGNFNTIIASLSVDVTAMRATPAFRDNAAQPIVDALRNFVLVHQALLSTVIGKHSIFAQFGLTAPILVVLRSLEAIIDSFAFAMIDLIPTRKTSVQTDQSNLDQSVGDCIKQYEQICIPSIFYPATMPICVSI